MTVKLTVILPVHNEAPNLKPLATELQNQLDNRGTDYELIFVDDGSEDDSRRVLTELENDHSPVQAVALNNHRGKSTALVAGLKHSQSSLVATMDSDGQDRPEDLILMLDELNQADGLAGHRINRADGWARKITSKLANSIRQYVTGDDIRDSACGLRLFRREVFNTLTRFQGMHRFLPTLARINGYTIREIDVRQRPRNAGQSSFSNVGRVFSTASDLLGVAWLKSRQIDYEIDTVINADS